MRRIVLAGLLALSVFSADTAFADGLQIMGGGPMQGAGGPLTDAFGKEKGIAATYISGSTRGTGLQDKLASGAAIDVVIGSKDDMDRLAKAGVVKPESVVVLARNGVGVGMRPGAPKPDLSTPEKFREAMLAAKSLALPDPKAGTPTSAHVTKIMADLGITDQVAKKAVWVVGVTTTKVASGEAELSIGSVPEVLVAKGAALAGPLPEALQMYTVSSVGIVAGSKNTAEAQAFIDFLAGADAAPIWKASGLDVLAKPKS